MSDRRTSKGQYRPTRTVPDSEEYDAGTISSLTRLLVGGALVGIDILTQQLEKWEREADSPDSVSEQRPAGPAKVFEQPQAPSESADTLSDQTRYAALGLLFYSQKYAKSASQAMGRAERAAWTLLTPLHKPLRNWRVFGPARQRYADMVTRGEAEIDRWVALGRDEARRSRKLAEEAIDSSIDESIDFVATSPQVRGALQETSTGLANEVADGMRARSVSYDTLLENLARRLIRRPPRQVPAEPPITAEMLEQDLIQTEQTRMD